MKNALIATMTAAVVLSTGAAFAESTLGNSQFHPTGFNNKVSSTFDGNRSATGSGHNQFDLNSFESNVSGNFDGLNRFGTSVAKEFAPWVGSK